MKKIKILSTAITILITISIFITFEHSQSSAKENNNQNLKIVSADADYPVYNSIAELEYHSDLIVEGKITGDRRLKNWESNGEVVLSANLSDFNVTQVYKGVNPGKTITVCEPAYLSGDTLFTIEGYNMMKKDSKYVLFLSKTSDDVYRIEGAHQGKYNIDNTDTEEYLGNESSKLHLDSLKKQVQDLIKSK